jgi:hypothetical protein
VGLKDRGQGDPCGSVQESIREKFNGHDGNPNRPHKKMYGIFSAFLVFGIDIYIPARRFPGCISLLTHTNA